MSKLAARVTKRTETRSEYKVQFHATLWAFDVIR